MEATNCLVFFVGCGPACLGMSKVLPYNKLLGKELSDCIKFLLAVRTYMKVTN